MNRWLICDDHKLMRGALAGCIAAGWPDAVVSEAADYPTAWSLVQAQDFDFILSDLVMPGASPVEGIARLIALAPATPLVVVTGNEEDELLIALFGMGIAGFVPKTASSEVIDLAIRLVQAGDHYIPQRVIDLVASRSSGQPVSVFQPGIDYFQLTGRQIEVLRYIAMGASTKEIARDFSLSPATIKTHTAAILAILGATNRTEAVAKARDLKLI